MLPVVATPRKEETTPALSAAVAPAIITRWKTLGGGKVVCFCLNTHNVEKIKKKKKMITIMKEKIQKHLLLSKAPLLKRSLPAQPIISPTRPPISDASALATLASCEKSTFPKKHFLCVAMHGHVASCYSLIYRGGLFLISNRQVSEGFILCI